MDEYSIFPIDDKDNEIYQLKEEEKEKISFLENIIAKIKSKNINYNFILKKEKEDINNNNKLNEYYENLLLKTNNENVDSTGVKKNNDGYDNFNNKEIKQELREENLILKEKLKLDSLFVDNQKRYANINKTIWWPVNLTYGGKHYYPSKRLERLAIQKMLKYMIILWI